MASATGTVVISQTGGNFDSADYPRFVLGDGTNSLTFVIDKDATRLQTKFEGEYATAYSGGTGQLPFEDSQRNRLAVPTYDNGSALKGEISIIGSDPGNATGFWSNVVANKGDQSGLRDISARPHWVLRDADGNEIKIGFGNSDATSLTNQGAVLIAKYGSSGSPRYWLYRETSTSRNYFIRVVNTGTNTWKFHMVLFAAFKHAYQSNLTNVDVQGITQTGTLQSASVGNDTYTASSLYGILLSYDTAGFKGNASSLIFNDPQAVAASASTFQKAVSWGYDEYDTTNALNIARHSYSPNNPQFWATNLTNEVFFKGGTIAGSDTNLSTANIAEAVKEMVNGSRLGITATRSDSTVNLTNDTDGDVGNVTITTTNEGSLFTVSGMSNAGGGEEESGGTSIMARTKIQSKLIAVGGVTKDNIASGSVGIGHLNFGEATAAEKASGSLGPDDLLAIYDSAAGSTKAVPLEHFKAFLSASVITNLTASGDVLIGDASSDEVNVAARFISSLIPKTDGLNDLGSSTLAWNTVFAESGSFSDNVGIGGDLAVSGDATTTGTVSGSAMQTALLTVDRISGKDIDGTSGTFSGTVSGSAMTTALLTVDRISGKDIDGTSGTFTGAVSGSSVTAHSFTGSLATIHNVDTNRLTAEDVDGTSGTFSGTVSGSTVNAQAIAADAATLGGVVANSLTASAGVLLGSSNSDDLSLYGGLITDLVPQNDSQVDLGSSSKQFAEAHIDTGNIDTVVASVLTASYAKITSLDVDEIVSRTVTKDSLEIKDNLIIAGVSGSNKSLFNGAGFQLGGTVGVEGTGSSPLFSLTLGNGAVDGDALVFNVGSQAGMTLVSGSSSNRLVKVGNIVGPRLGVTGSISGSLIQGLRGDFGHLSVAGAFAANSLSGAAGNFHDLTADDASIGGLQLSSLTASNGVILGSSNADDLSFLGGQITDLVPQNDNKVALGSATKRYSLISAMSASIAGNVGVVGSVEAAGNITSTGESSVISGSTMQAHQIFLNQLHGTGIVTQDNLQTGSVLTSAILDANVTTAKLADDSVTKAKLNDDIIQNNSDAHGGLVFSSGRLSVGFRKDVFVRADGSNISGAVPTHGMFATKAVATPYTTASLGAQPVSGTLMVYLNGVLLHGDYVGVEDADRNVGAADFHLLTGSANAYKILLNEELALDADDILTVTYLSGSGVSS